MITPGRWVVITTLLVRLGSGDPSWAQGNRVPLVEQEEAGWVFTFTPNLWLSGLSGSVGVGAGVAEVDLSFGDMVDEFDIGLMGLFEARRERWVLRTDLYYLSMSDQRAVSVSSTIPLDQEQLILQPEVGYAILRRDWGGVDALAGVRYWNLSLQLGSPPDTLTGDRNWVDGTVGLGLRYRPASSWQVFAKSDLGTGGSDFVWQALGGVGYDLGRCCTADAAYRHLSVDYRQDDFVYDVDLSGPAVGVTLHF